MTRGRKPTGPRLVDGLDGSESARRRLRIILETLAGEAMVSEACEALGVSEAGFHKLRSRFLRDAVGLMEPKKPGRKPAEVSPEEERIEDLLSENRDLKTRLAASEIRTEIALVMPHLLKDEARQLKKTPKRGKNGKRGKRKQ